MTLAQEIPREDCQCPQQGPASFGPEWGPGQRSVVPV